MKNIKFRSVHKRGPRSALSLFLSLVLCLSLLPAVPLPAAAEDAVPYYQEPMDKLINWGVLLGYPDGSLEPQNLITRAEFVAMVNRAYGHTRIGPAPFLDVPAGAWYAEDISIAYTAGYFKGTAANLYASPEDNLTREQALVMLARNMRLEPVGGEVTEFSDAREFADWSRGYAKAAYQIGMISGYPEDHSYRPQNLITRGEMATMLQRALGTLVNTGDTTVLGDLYGNVTLNRSGSTLKDTTIAGNLYISGGLDLGSITLDNVRILGSIVVAGGGEAQAGESVIMVNTRSDGLVVDSLGNNYVSLRAEGNTVIDDISIRSNSFVMDRTDAGQGLLNISLDGGDYFSLAGNLETVINKSADSTLQVAAGAVRSLEIDEEAEGSDLVIENGAAVRRLDLDTAVAVEGAGDVDLLNIYTEGSSSEMLPDTVDIRPGVTATVAGQEMDTVTAQESSSDPRLLAGYPKTKSVAPTSATAVFSTNKAGTIYWAVTATVDGSVSEAILMDPESSLILAGSGTLNAEASNTEYTVALAELTPGASYYLSAMLVDARGEHSPVKVHSFTTPDTSLPDFATGYPVISQNDFNNTPRFTDHYHAQISYITTKNCDLYYAVYAAGSTAPTPAEFRADALGGSLVHGMQAATRNALEFIEISRLDGNGNYLEEQTSYDVYLWLNDADNARSSNVQKLTFTTVDGSPPAFQYDTPTVITPTGLTNMRLDVTVDENATVYWVAVTRGVTFLKDVTSGEVATENALATAQRQIESGSGVGVVNKGSITVRANTTASINITGLAAATKYDIYYVAKDAAGNYSLLTKAGVADESMYKRAANTLDNIAPTVTLRFNDVATRTPYADEDIQLVFSEEVMRYSANRSKTPDDFESFLKLYEDVTKAAPGTADETAAKAALGDALRGTIRLYNTADTNGRTVADRADNEDSAANWTIDYREAMVSMDPADGSMTVTFAAGTGANLSSGATYYFLVDDISDISDSMNRMSRTLLDNFTTIAAEVRLEEISVGTTVEGDSIDMAFMMVPNSTNVDDDVYWDMLFWADTSISFKVYELEAADSGYTGTVITHTVKNGGDDGVAVVSDVPLETDDGVFRGVSLYGSFYEKSQERLKDSMKANEPKFYGIHITKIGDDDEATGRGSIWDATINFRVSVVTGRLVPLQNLATNVSASTLELAGSRGVLEIQNPNPFEMQAVFANQTAPNFASGYPTFTYTDTSASIMVALDRPGTLYYVVAPVNNTGKPDTDPTKASPITTTLDSEGKQLNFARNTEDTMTYATGVPQAGFSVTVNRGDMEFYLQSPTRTAVRTGTGFRSSRFLTGSIELGTGEDVLNLNELGYELEPDTLYFVYFVIQGNGMVYTDNAMLYQFHTEEVYRPRLDVNLTGSVVTNFRSDMAATSHYAIFIEDTMPSDSLGMNFFSTGVMGSAQLEKFQNATVPVDNETAPENNTLYNLYKTYHTDYRATNNRYFKVWEAMSIVPDPVSGASLFDLYATATFKETVEQVIESTTGIPGRYDGDVNIPLERNVWNSVNWTDRDTPIRTGVNYVFVIAAKSILAEENAGGESWSFKSTYDIYSGESEPPLVADIRGTGLIVDQSSGTTQITGSIYLTFDKNLYVRNQTTNVVKIVDSAKSTLVDALNNDATHQNSGYADHISVQDLKAQGSGTINIVASNATSTDESSRTQVIQLYLTGAGNTAFITLDRGLSAETSGTRSAGPSFTVNFDETSQKVIVEVSPSEWTELPNARAELTPETIIPNPNAVSAITIQNPSGQNVSSFFLDVDEIGTLTANPLPSSGASSVVVQWSISNPNIAGYTVNGNSIRLTGKAAGTTTVTATSGGKSASCDITVTPRVTAITLSSTAIRLSANPAGSQILTYRLTPGTIDVSASHTVIWESNNEDIATVDSGGVVTAKGSNTGSATITASVYGQQGSTSNLVARAYCTVTVY